MSTFPHPTLADALFITKARFAGARWESRGTRLTAIEEIGRLIDTPLTIEEVRWIDAELGGPVCRGCGCTDNAGCVPPCSWVELDLCSTCDAVDHSIAAGAEVVALDARDLAGMAEELAGIASEWSLGGDVGTLVDRVDLLVSIAELKRQVDFAAKAALSSLYEDLPRDEVVTATNGTRWKVGMSPSAKGWDKVALRAKINTAVMERVLDEATGELTDPSAATVVERLWTFADIATGRTKVLREKLGISLDDYAQVEWAPRLKEAEAPEVPPSS